ncbi:MAG: acetate--CoA ligase [Bacillota bacterium]
MRGRSKLNTAEKKPNLEDYEQTYARFRWEEAEKELGWEGTGKINIVYSCVDRHVFSGRGERLALIYDDFLRREFYTYNDLFKLSNCFGNALKKMGIQKGNRVVLFLPRSPEFYISFLAVVKIGAVAIPLYEGYMSSAVNDILQDSEPAVIITTPFLQQRIKREELLSLKQVIVTEAANHSTDLDWPTVLARGDETQAVEWVEREEPMLLMYTSGSTGKPKGALHVHEGALQYHQTGKWVLDLQDEDIYWCTADPSWVTGISYGIWAPLLNGATSVIYGGEFKAEKWYAILEKYKVSIWYTTPTSLRKLIAAGDNLMHNYNLSSLRHILSTGEPLNPMVIRWVQQKFGLTVHDTWWMTETGAHIIANFLCLPVKPGSLGKPIPGVYATIINEQGKELPPLEMGQLALKKGWPAMMRGIWKDPEKYQEYFRLPPWYLSGDLAYRDADGYFWFQGRADDVIKTAGERVGPFEIESKLAEHPAVLEAGVIGKPDMLRGEKIKAFVVLRPGHTWSEQLQRDVQNFIANTLASHLVPEEIEVVESLPRTKSGKIMRRVLKAREMGIPIGSLPTIDE